MKLFSLTLLSLFFIGQSALAECQPVSHSSIGSGFASEADEATAQAAAEQGAISDAESSCLGEAGALCQAQHCSMGTVTQPPTGVVSNTHCFDMGADFTCVADAEASCIVSCVK